MPKSTDACNRFVNLLYSATAWANVADNAATAPLTNVAVRLHTGLLTAATNSQAENEVAYTNYVGQNVARSTGWDAASGGSTANSALLQFPLALVASLGVLIGPAAGGASASITPQFLAGALQITES